MRKTPLVTGTLGAIMLSVPAAANSMAPYAYFWPGVLPIAGGLAFPASVLAAVIERPFLTWAGIQRGALAYSLQANFLSLLIGMVTSTFGMVFLYALGPLWWPVPIAVSVLSEGWYLRWKTGRRLLWLPIVYGNLLSSLLLLLLPVTVMDIHPLWPSLYWDYLVLYHEPLFWWTFAASLAVFLLSFLWPIRKTPEQDSALSLDSPVGTHSQVTT